MVEKTEYAVMQFVEQGSYSHMVHLTVQGRSVMEYAKEEVRLDKEKVIILIQSLAIQLREYYKCEQKGAYGYVNPYAIIITEEDEVRLLDVDAEENKELCAKMQKKKIRQLFVRPEYTLSQKRRREDDLYGFGKCVQFLLETCCMKKKLSLRERVTFQKIYTKCESKEKVDATTWQQFFNRLQKLKKNKKPERTYKLSWLACVIMLVLGWGLGQKAVSAESDQIMENAQSMELQSTKLEEQVLCLEEEIQQSKDALSAEQKYSSCLELCQKSALSEEQRKTLEEVFDVVTEKKKEQLSSEEGQLFTAKVYEKLYRYEAAITIYENLKQTVTDENEKKEIYRNLIDLYEILDMPDKVISMCTEAVEEYPEMIEEEKISMYYLAEMEEK